MTDPTTNALLARIKELEEGVTTIKEIIHTATKDTSFKTSLYHYQHDFDAIRNVCKQVLK